MLNLGQHSHSALLQAVSERRPLCDREAVTVGCWQVRQNDFWTHPFVENGGRTILHVTFIWQMLLSTSIFHPGTTLPSELLTLILIEMSKSRRWRSSDDLNHVDPESQLTWGQEENPVKALLLVRPFLPHYKEGDSTTNQKRSCWLCQSSWLVAWNFSVHWRDVWEEALLHQTGMKWRWRAAYAVWSKHSFVLYCDANSWGS